MRKIIVLLLGVVGVFAGRHLVCAQDLPDVAQGLQPNVAYHGGELDQVSTLNGGLTVRIPLVSYPQKGSLSLSYSVIFNSFGFEDVATCNASQGGPIDSIPLHNGCKNRIQLIRTALSAAPPPSPRLVMDQQLQAGGTSSPSLQYGQPMYGRFFIITPDNAEHPLGLAANGTYRSIDAAGYSFSPASTPAYGTNLGVPEDAYAGDTAIVMSWAAGTIMDSRGNTYTATSITDPDSNSISFPNGLSSFPVTDSTGRTIPALTSTSISQCPTIAQAQNQPLTSALIWQPPGSGNGYIFCYASVSIRTNLINGIPQNSATNHDFINTVNMLQSIVLPNGTYWGFVYDSSNGTTPALGQLLTLIYPTGGQVSYTYSYFDGFCNSLRESGLVPGSILTFPSTIATRTMKDAQGDVLGTWTYDYPANIDGIHGTILSPTGDLTVTKFTPDNPIASCSYLNAGQDVYQGNPATSMNPLVIPPSATPLRSTTVTYTFPGADGNVPVSNAREAQTTTVLNGIVTSSVQKSYSPGVNLAALQCNQWGVNCTAGTGASTPIGGPVSTTYVDYTGTTLKQDTTTYQWQANSAYYTANLLDIPSQTQTLNANGTVYAQTNYTYDESSYSQGGVRGHPTTITEWLNTGSSPVTHTGWNSGGEKAYIIDADNHQNGNGHTADYQYNACNGSVLTDTWNALNQHVSGGYDCNTGLLTSFTDANSNTTLVSWDAMRRITGVTYPQITLPGGTAANPVTTFNYADSQNTVTRTIQGNPDPNQVTTVIFDAFGREIHRYTAGSPGGQISVDTTYDADGRTYSVSNPYITAGEPTSGLTVYTYDALNRKTLQTQPDGNTQQWAYSGNVVDLYDELQHHKQQTTDALGRLTKVMEPDPSSGALALETDYSYDPLSNLLYVNQQGNAGAGDTARTRSFVYDSLSRLTSSTNPEAGTITYAYDAIGNLTQRTSPLPNPGSGSAVVGYCYDNLNRVTYKFYSAPNCPGGSNAVAAYTYDSSSVNGATNTVGRMTSAMVLNGGSGLSQRQPYAYNAVGHLTGELQCPYGTCSTPYAFQYQYDLAGGLVVGNNGLASSNAQALQFQYAWDAAGRLQSAGGAFLSTNPPAWPGAATNVFLANQSGSYGAFGLLSAQIGGTTLTETRTWDKRGRPLSDTDTGPGGVVYSYSIPSSGGYAANGDLLSYTDSVMGAWSFSYDKLDRLITGTPSSGPYQGQHGCWGYDSFGNRTVATVSTAACTTTATASYNANNQITWLQNAAPSGFGYAPSGNVANDGLNQYLYDNENRVCAVRNLLTNAMTGYLYDGGGARVAKGAVANMNACPAVQGFVSITAQYLLDPGGEQVTELDGSGNWQHTNLFAGGRLLATYDTRGQHFHFTDWLGTRRAQTTAAGVSEEQCQSLPFGDGLSCSGSGVDATEHHFTGKERDGESGNDYFGARYYSSTVGRFMTPDWSLKAEPVPYARLDIPQTLNLYAYVGNNPLTHTDVDGHQSGAPPPDTNDPACNPQSGVPCPNQVDAEKRDANEAANEIHAQQTNSTSHTADSAKNATTFDLPVTPHFEYSIGFTILWRIDSSGDIHFVGVGDCYSGKGAGLNNPFMKWVPGVRNKPDAGPTVPGTYRIGTMHDDKRLGGLGLGVMHLTPTFIFPPNRGFSTFYIHGNNNSRPQFTSSDGCLVCGPALRHAINDSGIRFMEVTQ